MADHALATETRLKAHAGTAALVGERVWQSALPQEQVGVTYIPAVVVQQITGTAEHVMGGIAGIVAIRIQVDSWDATRAGCQALAEQVRDALEAHNGTHSGTTITFTGAELGDPTWDPAAKLWRCLHQFVGWGTE